MDVELNLKFLWVPTEFGGHHADPYLGMRTEIRWQRYLEESLKLARDVECTQLDFDPESRQATAKVRFTSTIPVPSEWLQNGELVELMNGTRVVAIGRIVQV